MRHVRPRYSGRSRERIVQAPAPVKAIAKGRATFATLAHVVVSKFDQHLPLYRQADMIATQGVELDRSTLAGWAGQAAALLDSIVSRIRDEGLAAGKLHTDDTPVPVLDPGRGTTAQGGSGSMRSTIAAAVPELRRWSGIGSRLTAAALTRSASRRGSPATSRPMPMPVTRSCSGPGA